MVVTILRADGGTVVPGLARLAVRQVGVARARCYGSRGAWRGFIATLRTVVADGAHSVGWVREDGASIAVESGENTFWV